MSGNPLSLAIREQLISAGMEENQVFVVDAPDQDTALTITPYAATTDGDIPLSNISVQLTSRARGYSESREQAWAAFKTLLGSFPQNSDREVKNVVARQEPYLLAQDQEGRYIHVCSLSYICGWKE